MEAYSCGIVGLDGGGGGGGGGGGVVESCGVLPEIGNGWA